MEAMCYSYYMPPPLGRTDKIQWKTGDGFGTEVGGKLSVFALITMFGDLLFSFWIYYPNFCHGLHLGAIQQNNKIRVFLPLDDGLFSWVVELHLNKAAGYEPPVNRLRHILRL